MNPAPKTSALRRRGQAAVVLSTAIFVLTACSLGATARVFSPAATDSPIAKAGLGDADGYIANGDSLSPFDTQHPAVTNLDPALLAAVQRAAKDASRSGISMKITAGWRSTRYQQALLDDAIASYGGLDQARKWVNTPDKSTHVTGNAVDIGPTNTDSWLSQHGRDYGLCQTYANEMWHFELATTPGGQCPRMVSDAGADSSQRQERSPLPAH
jgi:hypothetical protein